MSDQSTDSAGPQDESASTVTTAADPMDAAPADATTDAIATMEGDAEADGEGGEETLDVAAFEGDAGEAEASAEGDGGASASRRPRRAALEREGEIAADFLETLLDICDLDGDLDVDIDGDRAAVSLVDSDEGRVPRRLVGQNGAVLEALQELTRLAVQSETGDRSRLMLDIAGHRANRRSVLLEQARVAIGKVKNGSEREALEPMTAFERKVVHDEVLAAGLVSESEGNEPRRFVVVLPG